jgi:hypothetical protein
MNLSISNSLFRYIGLMLLGITSMAVCAADKNLHRVEDLAYGVSIYHFNQGKYFSSITDLLVAEKNKKISNDKANPQLLLGGLYLSYGMYSKSADVFENLLENGDLNISAEVKDRVWYLSGKNYYENGMLDDAKRSLIKVKDSLKENNEEERLYWLNTIFLKKRDVVSAVDILYKMQDTSIWRYYSVFNTATYLIKAGTYAGYARQLLLDLSSIVVTNNEEKLLVDKANLALAYVSLKDNKQTEAVEHFLKIRTGGDVTSEALLGLGWAQYRNEDYDNSISSWMHLVAGQNKSDLVVQEALISIPYAFEKKTDNEQAIFQYDHAIEGYKTQINETQKLVNFIKSDEFIEQISPANMGDEAPLIFNGIQDVNPLMYRYLSKLISAEKFQFSVQSYQQAKYLRYKLDRWRHAMPALQMILNEKRSTYKSKLVKTLDDDSIDQVKNLVKRRNDLQAEVASIENGQLFYALATGKESEYIKTLSAVESSFKNLRIDNIESDELKFKHRLLSGLLKWRLETEYPDRLWKVKKQAKSLGKAIDSLQNRLASLKKTFKSAPKDFSQFDARIANKEAEIDQLKGRVGIEILKQENHLRKTALNALEVHRNQIRLYHDRALFAKARLYDSMMVKE